MLGFVFCPEIENKSFDVVTGEERQFDVRDDYQEIISLSDWQPDCGHLVLLSSVNISMSPNILD